MQAELERRLAALRAPNNNNARTSLTPTHVPGRLPLGSRSADADTELAGQVEAYLASFSPPSAPPLSLSTRASADERLNAALESYERTAPAFASPIEVGFHNPAVTGPTRTEDEDEQLIRRLRDELSLESVQGARDEDGVGRWSARLEGLKGVVVGGTDQARLGPGEAPEAVQVKDFTHESDDESGSDQTVDSDDEDAD